MLKTHVIGVPRLGLVSFLLAALVLLTACPKNEDRPTNSRIKAASPSPTPAAIVPAAVAFNGERAMDHDRKQIVVGPRISGCADLEKTRAYNIGLLTSHGLKIRSDEFTASTPISEKKMMNITAELQGASQDVISVASHYETQYFKDMRLVDANDDASSVATLLEIARVLATFHSYPEKPYWFAHFDGEESFCRDSAES